MHFNEGNSGKLTFCDKIPKPLQEGFERYRSAYYTKKKERAKAKALEGKSKKK